MTALVRLELALARAPMPVGQPIPAAVEVTGRNYRRAPTGALELARPPSPAVWENVLPIHWPQAGDDWGQVTHLALTLPDSGGNVAAAYPVSLIVRARDQVRIGPGDLLILGVGANTRRPYGAWRYGRSRYGTFPASGQIWAFAALLGWAWQQQANDCVAWPTAPAIIAGGCA